MHRRLLDTGLTVPPSYGNKTSESFTGDVNFDANTIIILVALLCALICALGLNSIVRCVLRCTDSTEQTTTVSTTRGLKKKQLKKIPVTEYGGDGGGEGVPAAEAAECPICLGEFEKGDKVRMLPKCNHGFHVRCIDTWLLSHSSCPNCRLSVLEKSVVKGLGGGPVVGGAPVAAVGPGDMAVRDVVVGEQTSSAGEILV